MIFEEYGTILYPYITNGNQLCYEVEVDGNIKPRIQYLPELPDDEIWECFGVDVDWNTGKNTISVSVVPSYGFIE